MKYALALGILLWHGLALAQQTAPPAPPPNPFPCDAIDGAGDFNFWLGRWEVSIADGTVVGTNHIVKEPGGCVLLERWTSKGQSTGISMNFFNPATSQWRQVWVGSGGSLIDIVGGLDGRNMALEGTITYATSGLSAPFRGRWSPLEDGRVRQFFEQFSAEDQAWQPWFEGFYGPTTSPP